MWWQCEKFMVLSGQSKVELKMNLESVITAYHEADQPGNAGNHFTNLLSEGKEDAGVEMQSFIVTR